MNGESHPNNSTKSTLSNRKNPELLDKQSAFKLTEVDLNIQDKIERVYIDEFKDVGDGRLYKG